MLRTGDKVVCINTKFDYAHESMNNQKIELEENKTYTIRQILGYTEYHSYNIINEIDENDTSWYAFVYVTFNETGENEYKLNRFISIKEHRKMKLEKICLV